MNTSMHGKKIRSIVFSGESSYQIETIVSGGLLQLELSATHHGDHDQFWVVKKFDGLEVARYNPRLIETIEWATPETRARLPTLGPPDSHSPWCATITSSQACDCGYVNAHR